jgi:hypothetical protein
MLEDEAKQAALLLYEKKWTAFVEGIVAEHESGLTTPQAT